MSAGVFEDTFYELDAANGGYITKARVQPETLSATDGTNANAAPAGPATLGITAKVSKTNREFGIKMRAVRLNFESGTPTGGVVSDQVIIPVMDPATFAAWALGASITYLTATWTVGKKFPEELT